MKYVIINIAETPKTYYQNGEGTQITYCDNEGDAYWFDDFDKPDRIAKQLNKKNPQDKWMATELSMETVCVSI